MKIVGTSVVSAVVYGVAHDPVTAHVCVEYFTVAHPPIFDTKDPTLLAFGWGVVATWWVGLILGLALAFAARVGTRPKLNARQLIAPVLLLLACTAVVAILAGFAGYLFAKAGAVHLLDPLASRVPTERHVPIIADLWAHAAAYGTAFLGGILLCARTWRGRRAKLVRA